MEKMPEMENKFIKGENHMSLDGEFFSDALDGVLNIEDILARGKKAFDEADYGNASKYFNLILIQESGNKEALKYLEEIKKIPDHVYLSPEEIEKKEKLKKELDKNLKAMEKNRATGNPALFYIKINIGIAIFLSILLMISIVIAPKYSVYIGMLLSISPIPSIIWLITQSRNRGRN